MKFTVLLYPWPSVREVSSVDAKGLSQQGKVIIKYDKPSTQNYALHKLH
jgi:hypothetical protein